MGGATLLNQLVSAPACSAAMMRILLVASAFVFTCCLASEPYHQIHVHLEEGVDDPIEVRRQYDEWRDDVRRGSAIAEREVNTQSQIDAAFAGQRAVGAQLSDIVHRTSLRAQS